jgi:hypothetical protein
MAKIRVQEDINVDKPSEDGYVTVVDNLIFGASDDPGEDSYKDFIDAEPDERVEILREAAIKKGSGGEKDQMFFVTHLVVEGGKGLGPIVDTPREIDQKTCRIFVELDKRKRRRIKKSRFTVALPDKQPKHVNYLQPYAEIIHGLYKQAEAAPTPQKAAAFRERAHKFMFGVMLLTRCR